MIVSHDRYFMDKLVDHLLVFEGNGIVRDFPGNYSEYRLFEEAVQSGKEILTAPEKLTAVTPQPAKKKVGFKEKREFELLEKELADLNREKETITTRLSTGEMPFDELQRLSARIGEITALLDEKEMRWLELSEMM
jgi:ABC transport system ATP-binding/permease protein